MVITNSGKDKLLPQNYRPTDLLSAMSKIAKRLVGRGLEEHTEELDILPDKQFGFTKQHSTEDQTFRLVKYIYEEYQKIC